MKKTRLKRILRYNFTIVILSEAKDLTIRTRLKRIPRYNFTIVILSEAKDLVKKHD